MSEQLAERLERGTRRTATGAHTTGDKHDAEDKDLALAISLSLGSSADTVGAGEAAGTREEGRAEEGGRDVPDPNLEGEDTRLHLDTKDLPEAAGVEDADAQADAGKSSMYSPPGSGLKMAVEQPFSRSCALPPSPPSFVQTLRWPSSSKRTRNVLCVQPVMPPPRAINANTDL